MRFLSFESAENVKYYASEKIFDSRKSGEINWNVLKLFAPDKKNIILRNDLNDNVTNNIHRSYKATSLNKDLSFTINFNIIIVPVSLS